MITGHTNYESSDFIICVTMIIIYIQETCRQSLKFIPGFIISIPCFIYSVPGFIIPGYSNHRQTEYALCATRQINVYSSFCYNMHIFTKMMKQQSKPPLVYNWILVDCSVPYRLNQVLLNDSKIQTSDFPRWLFLINHCHNGK